MVVYRIVFFDVRNRASHERTLECADDDDALDRVAMLRHPNAIELWQDQRLVWRFEAR